MQKNGKTFLYLWKWNSVWSQCYIKFIFGSFILSQPHTTLSAVQSPNSTGKLVGYFLQLFNWVVSSSSSSSTNFIATQVLNKTSGPLRVTYYTTAVMSMLLWPIVCIAVWSANSSVFSARLNAPGDSSDVIAGGSAFETFAAATGKARSPMVLCNDRGTCHAKFSGICFRFVCLTVTLFQFSNSLWVSSQSVQYTQWHIPQTYTYIFQMPCLLFTSHQIM